MSEVLDGEAFWRVTSFGLINSGVSEGRIYLSSGRKKNVLECLILKMKTLCFLVKMVNI